MDLENSTGSRISSAFGIINVGNGTNQLAYTTNTIKTLMIAAVYAQYRLEPNAVKRIVNWLLDNEFHCRQDCGIGRLVFYIRPSEKRVGRGENYLATQFEHSCAVLVLKDETRFSLAFPMRFLAPKVILAIGIFSLRSHIPSRKIDELPKEHVDIGKFLDQFSMPIVDEGLMA